MVHEKKIQFKVCQVAHGSVAYLDKHSTLDPVMVSLVSSILSGGKFLLKFCKPLDVNSCLKCKRDLIVKNSNLCEEFLTLLNVFSSVCHLSM